MGRSIHTTRRHLHDLERQDYADDAVKASAVQELKLALQRKRRIKRHVRAERRVPVGSARTCPETVPIVVRNSHPCVHFPADPQDLRNLMQELPQGVIDGLGSIELSLGRERQRDPVGAMERELDPDPLVGRAGYELLPGIYRGRVLGTYTPGIAKIALFAYVYDPSMRQRGMWELYLRMCLLSTFVHELAHHYDFTARVARGRWRADDREKVEIYAEGTQHNWVRSYVIPYLERTYPGPVAELKGRLESRAGVPIPLSVLCGDNRPTVRGGKVRIVAGLFNTAQAFEDFVGDVIRGRDLQEARIGFARDLHYAEEYDLATRIIQAVLADSAKNAAALSLQADILVHRGQYNEALKVARHALAIDGESSDALEATADAHEGLEDWARLARTASRLMDMHRKDSPFDYRRALAQHAKAMMELGRFDAACAEIEELAGLHRTRLGRQAVARLRRDLRKRQSKGRTRHKRNAGKWAEGGMSASAEGGRP